MLNTVLLDTLLSLDKSERYSSILDLSDKKDPDIYSIILYLIELEESNGSFGTLVYALRNYPPEPLFLKAIKWLSSGNFEVSHEAFEIINSINQISGEDVDTAYFIIKEMLNNDIEDWRKQLLVEVLEMFS